MELKNRISISYAIAVWNEHLELDLLIKRIVKNLHEDDEIVIQGDQGKVTDEVISVVRQALKNPKISYLEFPLKKDFATFKNNLIKNCSQDYIFLIDPDEIPNPKLLFNLKYLLLENQDVDLFYLPRVNIVKGLTLDYLQEQRWNLQRLQIPKLDYDSKEVLQLYDIKEKDAWEGFLEIETVNFPDYQGRIFRGGNSVYYDPNFKVHERLIGHGKYSVLPHELTYFNEINLDWSLFHVKDLERQKKQNNFYSTF